MPRPNRLVLYRLPLAIGLGLLLQGCQLSLPGQGPGASDVTPNAVTGDPIEVTALDAAPVAQTTAPDPSSAVAPVPADPAAAPTSREDAEAPVAETAPPGPVPEPEPAPPDVSIPEAAAELPDVPKPEAQLACERRKGRWVPFGQTGQLRTCVFPTRDSGKQCSRQSDCDGACLARSGTCAPFKPLIGCHEVLLDNGVRATQCIE